MIHKLMCAVFVSMLAAGAGAATVWRCGPEGRDYSAQPCPGGRVVAVDGRVSEAARAEAEAVADRERSALQSLAQERRAREAEGLWQGAAGIPRLDRPEAPSLKDRRKERRKDWRRRQHDAGRDHGHDVWPPLR